MRFSRLLAPIAAAVAVSLPGMAAAAEGDWLFRLGIGVVDPKDENLEDVLGGTIQVDDDTKPIVEVTYMLTDHIGTELLASWPFTHSIDLETPTGTVNIGETDHLPPTLSLQWHFNPDGKVKPYVGAGVNWTIFSGESVSSSAGLPAGTKLELDDSVGLATQAGIDWFINEKWFVNAEVRWIDIDTDATVKLPDGGGSIDVGTVEIDPFVYGLNVGYRFGRAKPVPVAAAVAAPVVAAVAPPAPEKCADGDNDGVCDAADRCPDTPAGTRVGAYGCACDVSVQTTFAFDSTELTAEDKATLDRVADQMKQLDFVIGEAGGHTDSVGDDAYNVSLSERRAQAVHDYLVAKGVGSGRVKVVGYGEAQPIADNATDEGRAKNRRVVLRRTDCPAPR